MRFPGEEGAAVTMALAAIATRSPKCFSRADIRQRIDRTADPCPTHLEHMGIDHGRCDVAVSEQLLNGSDVVARLQQGGRKGMPQRVRCGEIWISARSTARLNARWKA